MCFFILRQPATAMSTKNILRGDLNLHEQRQIDYKQQVGICKPQPVAFLQLSSGSSQPVSPDPRNIEYVRATGGQQRIRRKKSQHFSRESYNESIHSGSKRGKLFRYENISDIHISMEFKDNASKKDYHSCILLHDMDNRNIYLLRLMVV